MKTIKPIKETLKYEDYVGKLIHQEDVGNNKWAIYQFKGFYEVHKARKRPYPGLFDTKGYTHFWKLGTENDFGSYAWSCKTKERCMDYIKRARG